MKKFKNVITPFLKGAALAAIAHITALATKATIDAVVSFWGHVATLVAMRVFGWG